VTIKGVANPKDMSAALRSGLQPARASQWRLLGPSRKSTMLVETSLSISQHVVQVCLFLVAAIAVFGGALQFYLGQPETAASVTASSSAKNAAT
jgi:hypothetical protein